VVFNVVTLLENPKNRAQLSSIALPLITVDVDIAYASTFTDLFRSLKTVSIRLKEVLASEASRER